MENSLSYILDDLKKLKLDLAVKQKKSNFSPLKKEALYFEKIARRRSSARKPSEFR